MRIEDGEIFEIEERMPREVELDILVNGALFAKATLTPSLEREFVAGHLRYQGLIENGSQIRSLKVEGHKAMAEIDSRSEKGLGCSPLSGDDENARAGWTVRADWILANLLFTLDSDLYRKTGGTHTSSLCRGEAILVTAEDVGRLNTLDKVFGWALLNGVDLHECYVATSGRITSHTMRKVIRSEVPLVASKGAVTTLAVDMAEAEGVTLVGFARENRISVYAGASRISWG